MLAVPIQNEWEVTGGYRGRLPGPFEADLYVAVHALWNEAGRPEDGTVRVRTADLLRRMRKGDGGKQYELLTDALHRLESVRVRTRLVLENGERGDLGFGLLDGHRVAENGWATIRLSRMLCETLAAQGRALDTQRYFSLSRPAARRLFRYLDHRRYRGGTALEEAEFPLAELAAELPVLCERPTDQKKTLRAAHDELIAAGFLRSATHVKLGRTWVVRYVFGAGQAMPAAVSAPELGFADRVELAMRVLREPQHGGFYSDALKALGDAQFDHLLGSIREQIRDGLSLDAARKFFAAGVRARSGRPAATGARSRPPA